VHSTHPAVARMLQRYDLSTPDRTYEALREILQEIVLLGLSRADFFDRAVFYGGTALRLLYGLDRFSEDLDFSLKERDVDFDLSVYEESVMEALHSFGFETSIQIKHREGPIRSAFVKGNTMQHLLNIAAPEEIVKQFGQGRLVKVKIEVDTQPPLDFDTEIKTLLVPSPFTIKTMRIPSLFAGKIHAILCRNWVSRPKGRDWYDLIWYVANGYGLDLRHLRARLRQNCAWMEEQGIVPSEAIDEAYILELLHRRIRDLDIHAAKRDVKAFIQDKRELEIWSREFFEELAGQIKFERE